MDTERRLVRDGAVAIDGDRIVAVGRTADVAPAFSADRVLDARGKLVLPGLIDTHVHNTQQLGRGLADDVDVARHLLERLYGYESALTEDDAYWAARLCQLEMIRAGTTCFVDPGSFYPAQTARAAGESGLRGVVARTAFDVHDTGIGSLPDTPARMFREGREEAVARAAEAVDALNGQHGGRIRAWFSLRILVGCSDTLCGQIVELAAKRQVGVVAHAAESRDETVASRMQHGVGDVERLGRLGLLNPRMLLIHVGWATPRELVLLRDHDVKVSCTPGAGCRLGFGSLEFGRFPEMLELGVAVSLGSDGAMSGNYLDIVRQMYLVAGATKSQHLNATVMPPETVVEMATVHGARAALWEREIGSLEPGKKADVAIFAMDGPEWRPVINPLANLVYACRGGADTVLVDGQVLMEAGVVRSIDEAETLAECQRRAEVIAARSGLRDRALPRWPML
jgi:5-methylthioadenosine/S-adenosylhomocysteine deaminase